MNIVLHNLKIAFRNLMKYKLQTLISVLSIAIGIVTLSLVHSLISAYKLPSIYYESYYDRAYKAYFQSSIHGEKERDVIRTLKKEGSIKSAEKRTVAVWNTVGIPAEFHLTDSTVRKGYIPIRPMDSGYAEFVGLRSAITGKKIKKLKHAEAIVSKDFAKAKFQDKNPIRAVQTFTLASMMPIPVTIVDVFEPVGVSDYPIDNTELFFNYGNGYEDYDYDSSFFVLNIQVILREGCSEQQLLKEINDAVAPYDVQVELFKVSEDPEIRKIIKIRVLSYLFGSLILLAAIIGFLRIQTQLFRIRQRELALRIVNGASRKSLFGMLFTEVFISICSAVILAILLGFMLQDFVDMKLDFFLDRSVFKVTDLWQCSIVVGGFLLIVCSLIAWLTLQRVCRSRQGLTENISRNRNQLFRQVMLGLQTTIVLIVITTTFILLNAEEKIIKACNVPDNDSSYREYLFWAPTYNTFDALYDEFKRLPELDRMIKCGDENLSIQEVEQNQEAKERFASKNQQLFKIYCTDDTTLLSALGIEVKWLGKDVDKSNCILLNENLYTDLKDLGLLDHYTLTIGESYNGFTLPVGGIIKSFPYDMQGDKNIAISQEWSRFASKEQLLIPKEGRGKSLARNVNEVIDRVHPEYFDKMVFNYRERTNSMPDVVEAVRIGGWILGCVSLVICAMSVLSTITLDTRRRLKEVAIRKVNGAKSKDIYGMFGRMYLIILFVSLIISVPVSVLCNQKIQDYVQEIVPGTSLSPVLPIILGFAIVCLLILLIVGWQIHRVMQVDPAKIIAKE